VERSIEIKAPPGRVWEMLALDRQAEWMDELKSSEYTSEVRTPEDKYRVGASAHIIEKHVKYDLEITEILENEKLTARSKGMAVTMTLTFLLESVGEGTKLTYAMDWVGLGIFGKISDKTFGQRIAEKGVEKSLNNLKSILEK